MGLTAQAATIRVPNVGRDSLATQIIVIFAIRTKRTPFWRSRPSRLLTGAMLGAIEVAILLPLSPLAHALGFVALPLLFWPVLAAMVGTYLLIVELVKRRVFGSAPG
jgi:Mg2+-importing ATPase